MKPEADISSFYSDLLRTILFSMCYIEKYWFLDKTFFIGTDVFTFHLSNLDVTTLFPWILCMCLSSFVMSLGINSMIFFENSEHTYEGQCYQVVYMFYGKVVYICHINKDISDDTEQLRRSLLLLRKKYNFIHYDACC